MSITSSDIRAITAAAAKFGKSGNSGNSGLSDTAILWLIIGGWMAIVAVLSTLSEIQAMLAR